MPAQSGFGSLFDESEGLTSLEGQVVSGFLGELAVNSVLVEEFAEHGFVENVAVWSLGVHDLQESSGFIDLEGAVLVYVVGLEKSFEKLLELCNADWGESFGHL